MLQKLHDHILTELAHSTHADSIFVAMAIGLNLLLLGINSALATTGLASTGPQCNHSPVPDIALAILIVMTIVLAILATAALNVGKRTRAQLLNCLSAIYRDNAIDQYYSPSLAHDYALRYTLFQGVIGSLATAAILIPLIIRLIGTSSICRSGM